MADRLEDEASFHDIRLGRRMHAGYFYGTAGWHSPAGEHFRAEITDAILY